MTVEVEEIVQKIMEMTMNFVNFIPKVSELEKMSTTELYIFLLIGTNQRVFNSEVSKKLGISRSTVSMALKRLSKSDLIEMVEDELDRRFTRICLSEKGKKIYNNFLKSFSKIIESVFKSLEPEEVQKLNESFDTLLDFSNKAIRGE
ncbi:MAG: MarR family winged helix-turn-helix transcriptional regulator [Fervidobacterium sp.]